MKHESDVGEKAIHTGVLNLPVPPRKSALQITTPNLTGNPVSRDLVFSLSPNLCDSLT